MHRTANALTTFATVVLLGGVTLAQEPQSPNASDLKLAMDEMMKQCIEHCRSASGQAASQADGGKQAMGCMSMMDMQSMQGGAMKNMPEMKDIPATKDMPGMVSGTRVDGATAGPLPRSLKMATSVRELERVCGQKVDPRTAPKSTFNGKTYYFCAPEDKTRFDQSPAQFIDGRSRQERREEPGPRRPRRC